MKSIRVSARSLLVLTLLFAVSIISAPVADARAPAVEVGVAAESPIAATSTAERAAEVAYADSGNACAVGQALAVLPVKYMSDAPRKEPCLLLAPPLHGHRKSFTPASSSEDPLRNLAGYPRREPDGFPQQVSLLPLRV
jgi:hypothetical protein